MSDEEARVLVPEPDPWSQLKAENEELFEMSQRDRRALEVCRLQRMTAEATMREVAEELRASYERHGLYHAAHRLADRLDPPPVVENPPNTP